MVENETKTGIIKRDKSVTFREVACFESCDSAAVSEFGVSVVCRHETCHVFAYAAIITGRMFRVFKKRG